MGKVDMLKQAAGTLAEHAVSRMKAWHQSNMRRQVESERAVKPKPKKKENDDAFKLDMTEVMDMEGVF